MSETDKQIRIDKWLWFARQTRSRSLAQKLVTAGRVRINREKIHSPSKMVGIGDVLTLTAREDIRVLKVVDCGVRRGPYSEARKLYEDLSPPVAPAAAKPSRAESGLPSPLGRPDGRERRKARKLSGKE